MKRGTAQVLGGKSIDNFQKAYPNISFHCLLKNTTVYVAGKEDRILLLVSDDWDSRLLDVGEYADA